MKPIINLTGNHQHDAEVIADVLLTQCVGHSRLFIDGDTVRRKSSHCDAFIGRKNNADLDSIVINYLQFKPRNCPRLLIPLVRKALKNQITKGGAE